MTPQGSPRRAPRQGGFSVAWLIVAAAYVGLIFFLSSRPYLVAPGPQFAMKDKLAHLLEYSVLGGLLFQIFAPRLGRMRLVGIFLVFAVAGTIAAADEMFQGTIPGRQRDATDWLADVTGATTGATLVMMITRRRRVPGEESA